IGPRRPSSTCVEANAHALARYAALAQEAGLVPIVEPEVLLDGEHDLDRCAEVTLATLRAVYDQLARHRVVLEATLLKPSMVLPGKDSPHQVSDEEAAAATVEVLREAVPAAVPGIVFLSGGMTDEQATARLAALNRTGPQPWQLSFSFGRALQGPVLRAWAGDEANREAAQQALLHRAELNSAARYGKAPVEV
ncbi:MAG TPA: class I fructose-bisphosphate aldolase, partial [Nocardioides sp.]|nr:class I fructose-bisphosphate aldolase [Nocardioides sp.]